MSTTPIPPAEKPPLIVTTSWAKAFLGYRWPLTIITLGVLELLVWQNLFPDVTKIAKDAKAILFGMTKGFQRGTITQMFRASIPQLERVRGGNLELTSQRATEVFKREDNRRVFWDYVSLGTTVTEIRVPVTYRYYVRLREKQWDEDRFSSIRVIFEGEPESPDDTGPTITIYDEETP